MDDDTDDITVERRFEWWLAEGWEVRLTREAQQSGAGQVAIELVGYEPNRGEVKPSPYGVGEDIGAAVSDLIDRSCWRMRPHPDE